MSHVSIHTVAFRCTPKYHLRIITFTGCHLCPFAPQFLCPFGHCGVSYMLWMQEPPTGKEENELQMEEGHVKNKRASHLARGPQELFLMDLRHGGGISLPLMWGMVRGLVMASWVSLKVEFGIRVPEQQVWLRGNKWLSQSYTPDTRWMTKHPLRVSHLDGTIRNVLNASCVWEA